MSSPYDVAETRGKTGGFDFHIILLFPYLKLVVKNFLKISVAAWIIAGKAEFQHGMRLPIRLQLLDGKTFEQFPFTLEICLNG